MSMLYKDKGPYHIIRVLQNLQQKWPESESWTPIKTPDSKRIKGTLVMTLLRWIVPASWLKCTWCRKWCQGPEKSSCAVEFSRRQTFSQHSKGENWISDLLISRSNAVASNHFPFLRHGTVAVALFRLEQFVALEPFPPRLQNPKSAMLNVRSLGQYPLLVCTALCIFLHLSLSLWKLWLVKTGSLATSTIYWQHVPKRQRMHFARTFAWTSRSSALRQVSQHDLGQKSPRAN